MNRSLAMARDRCFREQAFTLLELMVVIVLIGIMTALIVPEMKGSFEDALLRSVSRELVDTCNLAYSRAVSLNQAHRIRVEAASGRYVVERSIPGRGGRPTYSPVRDVPGCEGKLDSRIAIKIVKPDPDDRIPDEAGGSPGRANSPSEPFEPDMLSFFPDGTAEGGEVLLRDRHGFGIRLRLNPVTARVTVTELPRL